jgi:hypothetical protein
LPDGTRVPFDGPPDRSLEQRLERPSLADVFKPPYPSGPIEPVTDPEHDPGRVRVEALFQAAYGRSAAEVEAALVPVSMAGRTFRVHRRAREAFERVARRVDALVAADPALRRFFAHPGGTFVWRPIAGTERQSAHSYGIALDLDPALGDYWRNAGHPSVASWRNRVPQPLVDAFEAEGFAWGGRWYHYDTMHFEWRPELAACRSDVALPGPAVAPAAYPWIGEPGVPPLAESLEARFAAPAGFTRVPVEPGSFGAFLRGLPLAPQGTPAVAFNGEKLYADGAKPGFSPNVAAVVALDVGSADLQQCADSIIRLDAEWRWSKGLRNQAYRTASGQTLSFARWLEGDRVRAKGSRLEESRSAAPQQATRRAFKGWLDSVFSWANTASLSKEGVPVPLAELQPGDFMVMAGVPFGHAVLVLDAARAPDGSLALLLGQGYMPAQSFQVLRPEPSSPWFVIAPDAAEIATPFWQPFPVGSLRRFRGGSSYRVMGHGLVEDERYDPKRR